MHAISSEIGDQVEEVANNVDASVYAEGEIKLSAGANYSAKIEGLGVDANIMIAEIASISGEIDNSGANGKINWVGRDGEVTIEHVLGVGYEGANVDASLSYTSEHGKGIVQKKISAEGGYGVPGLTIGARYENSKNTKSKTSKHTLMGGVFTGGAIGTGWRLSISGSAGFKVNYTNTDDE